MKILECRNLTKEYLSGDGVIKAIDDISLSFEQGEFVAITGPSGSGKSTLLHNLSSLENPTGGEIFYNGESLKKYNDKQLSKPISSRIRATESPIAGVGARDRSIIPNWEFKRFAAS